MPAPQEAQLGKVGLIAAAVVVLLGAGAWWVSKNAPELRLEPPSHSAELPRPAPADPVAGPQPAAAPADPHPVRSSLEALRSAEVRAADAAAALERGVDPGPSATPAAPCGASEGVTVRPGVPVQVAGGLATLSVSPRAMGSGSILILNIATAGHAWVEAVLETPVRFDFETKRGPYHVDVKEADVATGALRVEVGCGG